MTTTPDTAGACECFAIRFFYVEISAITNLIPCDACCYFASQTDLGDCKTEG